MQRRWSEIEYRFGVGSRHIHTSVLYHGDKPVMDNEPQSCAVVAFGSDKDKEKSLSDCKEMMKRKLAA